MTNKDAVERAVLCLSAAAKQDSNLGREVTEEHKAFERCVKLSEIAVKIEAAWIDRYAALKDDTQRAIDEIRNLELSEQPDLLATIREWAEKRSFYRDSKGIAYDEPSHVLIRDSRDTDLLDFLNTLAPKAKG